MRILLFIAGILASLHTGSVFSNDEPTSLLHQQAHETIVINGDTTPARQAFYPTIQTSYATEGSFENCLLSSRTGAQIGSIMGCSGWFAVLGCILTYDTCFSPLAHAITNIGGICLLGIGGPVAGAITGATLGSLMSLCCTHAKANQ